jgi:hypothetical protein
MCENIINFFYKVLKYTFINVILIKFLGTEFPRSGGKILSQSPNLFQRNFLLHPHPHGEKYPTIRSPFTDEIDIPRHKVLSSSERFEQ